MTYQEDKIVEVPNNLYGLLMAYIGNLGELADLTGCDEMALTSAMFEHEIRQSQLDKLEAYANKNRKAEPEQAEPKQPELFKTCKHCGSQFVPGHPKAKFCSNECRRDWHRAQKKLEKRYQDAIDLIAELSEKVYDLDESLESVLKLKTLERIAQAHSISNADSWWRCQNCWTVVRKEIPDYNDCKCGKNSQWVLQKTMI